MKREEGKLARVQLCKFSMLENSPYLVSQDLSSVFQEESKCTRLSFKVIELSMGNHHPEVRNTKDQRWRRPSEPLNASKRDKRIHGYDHSLANGGPIDNQENSHNSSESSELIKPLGREISISCLLRCSRSDYGSIASVNQSFRNLFRSGEIYRLRRAMGIKEHWIYFSCFLLEWHAFDPICNRWMVLPIMPSNECFKCSDKESLAVGTELLVFGNDIFSNVIYKYSILTNSWSIAISMNNPRCLFGSASLGEIAILAGGCDSKGKILNLVELYNSETGTWTCLPPMNKGRKLCSGFFLGRMFYVIGGIGVDKSVLNCGEVFDLDTETWRVIPNMFPKMNDDPGTFEAPPLVAVVNDELYGAYSARKELRRYDSERNLWITVGRLPERVNSIDGWGLAFKACGDQLVVIGGPRELGGSIIEISSWVPCDGPVNWSLLAGKYESGSFVYNCSVMGC